jgi:hypothetical protein
MSRTVPILVLLAAAFQAAPQAVAQGAAPQAAAPRSAALTAKNPLDLARSSETLAVPAAELRRLLGATDARRVHVRDDGGGQEVLSQAIDLDEDGTFDELIFQADFGPRQVKTFTLSAGERLVPRIADFKAYGRFVRERLDDFAWENDRIAHRMYGAALETSPREPLKSSAVDVWSKRVRRLVINDWYMVDDYHQDNGTGGDFYSAGRSRGCGGNGVWAGGRLYPSANFHGSRVLANGPIRVMFELTYPAWDAGGTKVAEVKRVTLDAGHNLDRFESRYRVEGDAGVATHAAGIKKNAGVASAANRERGILRTWEPVKGQGNLGCAVLVDPGALVEFAETDGDYLAVGKVENGTAVYYAGFGWDKSGDFKSVEDWDRYLAEAARRLRAPIEVALGPR